MTANPIDAISVMPKDGKPNYLLLMLHGWGANYQDLVPLAQMLDLPSFGYLFPNAPYPHFQVPGGRAWYALETDNYEGLVPSREMLFDWLMSLEKATEVPLKRTIMAGFSQGGAMTLDVGHNLPFAALCSLSGYLHFQPQPLENSDFPPVLIVHGTQDPVVPLEAAQKARDELTKIGVSVQYQEFNMGHEIQPPALKVLQQFITDIIQGK